MLQEFKKFIFRGDVIALSTGVIIGGAFGKIVTAFTDGIVKPILALAGADDEKGPAIGFLLDSANPSTRIDIGIIIAAIISFLITAAVIFFFIIKPSQAFAARMKKEEVADPPAPPAEVVLLTEIRDALQKKA